MSAFSFCIFEISGTFSTKCMKRPLSSDSILLTVNVYKWLIALYEELNAISAYENNSGSDIFQHACLSWIFSTVIYDDLYYLRSAIRQNKVTNVYQTVATLLLLL